MKQCFGSSFQSPISCCMSVLSVLPLLFSALAGGAVSSICRDCSSMAAGLQMVEQFVSCGELVIAGNTAEVYFLLELQTGKLHLNYGDILTPKKDANLGPKKKDKKNRVNTKVSCKDKKYENCGFLDIPPKTVQCAIWHSLASLFLLPFSLSSQSC